MAPPSDAGAVKATVAVVPPVAVATPIVGAPALTGLPGPVGGATASETQNLFAL